MTLAVDANSRTLMTRVDLPVGEFRTLADGAAEKPVNTWRRLMPHGNDAETVSRTDGTRYINLTRNVRSSVLDVTGWVFEILNKGHQQKNIITRESGGSIDFRDPIQFYEALGMLSLRWVMYPILNFPIVIRYQRGTAAINVDIGITDQNIYTPTNIVKIASIENGNAVVIPTQQIGQLFYRIGDGSTSRNDADTADIDLSWGEHYIRS